MFQLVNCDECNGNQRRKESRIRNSDALDERRRRRLTERSVDHGAAKKRDGLDTKQRGDNYEKESLHLVDDLFGRKKSVEI